ncbi:unnamed protein product [Tilletia caries]|uniref:DDE Tnp4 domain-containing protein n=2 Tax=Tilletia caries TaxID=13290 RepID=A0ABN7IW67_9BASI|nr:unnamed protein product [Tilletia caries]
MRFFEIGFGMILNLTGLDHMILHSGSMPKTRLQNHNHSTCYILTPPFLAHQTLKVFGYAFPHLEPPSPRTVDGYDSHILKSIQIQPFFLVFPACSERFQLSIPVNLLDNQGVRYHLKEYDVGTKRPRNSKELYNRRHAGVRSVIERIFGVMQARFKILTTGCYYDVRVQADFFPALAVVHNFIRRHDPHNDVDNVQGIGGVNDEEADEVISATQTAEAKEATKVRNRIAKRMWKKYNS